MEHKDKIKNVKLRVAACAVAGALAISTTGCSEREMAEVEEYDVLEQTDDGVLELPQVLEVPGEDFKLVTEYTCDAATKRKWRVTADKFLYFKVNTQDLPDDVEVYIDNVHIDTSIKSKYAVMDGIKQDDMDDHVHTSQAIGYFISDEDSYYGTFAIEGCNKDFIEGTFYGHSGYSSGSVTEKRYTEQDYMDFGVYANKFQVIYDLLVRDATDKGFRNVSVSTDFLVPITDAEFDYSPSVKEKTKTK